MTEKVDGDPSDPRGLRALRKNGKLLFKEAEKLRSKYLTTLSDRDALLLDAAMQRVQGLLTDELKVKDIPALEESQEALDGLLDTLLGSKRRVHFGNMSSIVYAVAIALLIRTAVVEPFKIPFGSMIPTLEINDHIFVSKFSCGVRAPFSGGVRIGSGNPIERGVIHIRKP